MTVNPKTLRIYVARHCETCIVALHLAREIGRKYQLVRVEVIDLDAGEEQNLDDVFSVPTYLINNKVVSLGNPTLAELEGWLSDLQV